MATSSDIVIEARRWIGTPFVHQGHVRGIAADCLGLGYGIAKTLGLVDIELPAYGREPTGNALKDGLGRYLDKVNKKRPGDVIVFKLAFRWQHVAIYTGAGIIHAWQPVGKVIETSFDPVWLSRHAATGNATYRFRGLADG